MTAEAPAAASEPGPGWVAVARDRMGPVKRWLGHNAIALLSFAIVLYLALRGGGYDAPVRGELGIFAWWLVLVGVAIGILPAGRLGAAAWGTLGLLLAFTVWTGLAVTWTESEGRTLDELARLSAYLGVFAFALMFQGDNALRGTVHGVAAAIGIVAVVAALARLQPGLIAVEPKSELAVQGRLSYPLGYWNGLGALMAVGAPLLLSIAASSRSIPARVLAAATLPVLTLVLFLTLSRGGFLELGVALIVLLALYPARWELLAPTALAAAGTAILISAAAGSRGVTEGLANGTAVEQANELTFLLALVCAVVAMLQLAGSLAAARGLLSFPRVSPRWARRALAGGVIAALVAGAALNVPGALDERWEDFKQPYDVTSTGAARLSDPSGGARYELWQAAVDANATAPLIGIGPGTFEFWWSRNATTQVFVRDAHSLYMETLAEVGVIGLVLIVAMIAVILAVGIRRAWRRRVGRTSALAAATAAAAAFALAATFDWVWELTVLPVAFLLLAAAILGPDAVAPSDGPQPHRALPIGARLALVLLSITGITVIAWTLATANLLADARLDTASGDLPGALGRTRRAVDLMPGSAHPRLQEALVLEDLGDLEAAAAAAKRAAENEPTNWRNWVVRSRLEAKLGNARVALHAYRRARMLNPRSALFSPPGGAVPVTPP